MKIYLDTIGCRLNQSEIETYARQFRARGHTLVSSPAQADLVVVNTCTVTAAAASDSRQKIRQAARLGAAQIIATGCWATLNPQEAASLPQVSRVVLNSTKDRLVHEFLQISDENLDDEVAEREPVPGRRSRTRAFLKVQDGCDNRCTFCITTLARGPGISRPIPQVLTEVRAAQGAGLRADHGAREIILTGVHLGSWGHDFSPPQQLRHLVKAILDETDLPRLRLSSLEPWDLDRDFFVLWENPRLCRQLHLPLQSGSAATLRRMGRKTTPQAYAGLVSQARAAIPGVAVTTDIIVGFPGEDEAEFAESLDFVRRMQFAGGHVFTYSARPGTAAARMPDQVPYLVRKERNEKMRLALAESSNAFRRDFLGHELHVLWESATLLSPGNWALDGLTDNYLRVGATSHDPLHNRISPVRLTALSADGLSGDILSS